MGTIKRMKYQEGGEANMPSPMELQLQIKKQLEGGAQPEALIAELLQMQISEQDIKVAFESLGMPEDQVIAAIDVAVQQLNAKASEEEMGMMEQPMMPEASPDQMAAQEQMAPMNPNIPQEYGLPDQMMQENPEPASSEDIAQLEAMLPKASTGAFIPPHQRGIGRGGGSLYLPDYGTDQKWETDVLNMPKMPRPLYNNVMMHQNPLANLVTSVADFGRTLFSKKDRDGDGHSDGIFRRDTKEQKSVPGYKSRKKEWRDNKGAYQRHTIDAGLNADGTPRSEADFKENYVFDQTNREVLSKDDVLQRFTDNSSIAFDEETGRYKMYASDNKRDNRRNIRKHDAVDLQEFGQRMKDNPDQAKMLFDYYGQTEKETGIPTGTTLGIDKDGYGTSYAPGTVNPDFYKTAMYENTLKKHGGSLSHGGENLMEHDSMQKDLKKVGPEFLQAFMQVVNQGTPTHTMPDGTVHPGATHEEYLAMQQGLPSYQYRGEFNLNLPKLTDAEKIGLGTGATFGLLSSFTNPSSSISKNIKVKNTAQQMCTDNTCPAGSTDWKDYTNRANMELGIGEDPNRPGYFSSDEFATGNVGKAWGKTLGRTALGAGAGWLTGYGSQWLGHKLAPKVFANPGKLFRQGGGENASNLYEFYEGNLPSIAERADLFKASGLGSGYTGTASENKKLLEYLKRTDNIPLDQDLDEITINAKRNPNTIAPMRPPSIIESSLPEPQLMMSDQSVFSTDNPNSIFYNPTSEQEEEETATETSMIGPTNNNVGPVNNSMLSNTDDDDTDYSNLTTEPGQLTANLLEADKTNLNVDNDPSATFNQVANMGNQNTGDTKNNIPPLQDDDLPISTIDYDGDGVNDLYPKAPMVGPQNQPPADDPEKDLSVDPSVVDSRYGDTAGEKITNWTNRQLDRPGVQKFGKFSEGVVNVADAATDFLRYGKFLQEKNDKSRTQADKIYGMVAATDRGDQDENTGYFIDNKVVQMGGDPFNNLQQMLPPTPTTGEAEVSYDTLLKLIAAGADIEIL
jgi:hypothetical protein